MEDEPNKKEEEKRVETPGRQKPKRSETEDEESSNGSTRDNFQSSSNETNSRRTRSQVASKTEDQTPKVAKIPKTVALHK